MSLMAKVQEVLAANPGVSWNDLVLRRLRTALSSTDGALNDLWMRWLAGQGHSLGGLQDRMASYWRATSTPLNERNAFYLGYTAFFGVTVPGAPAIGTATAGNTTASVAFTAPGSTGGSPILDYRATSSPGGIQVTGAVSPINVTGLTNGTPYTFTVQARNAIGFSADSAASNSVTPVAPTFALTNRTVAASGQTNSGIFLNTNGSANEVILGSPGANITNQWVASGAFPTIGNGYECVPTIITGTPATFTNNEVIPLSGGGTSLTLQAGGGSFSVIIRPLGGGTTVAGPATITVT